jgi:hypothetical protein
MSETKQMYLIKYRHDNCEVKPGVEWEDTWDCACNGQCPECGMKDIEPCDYDEITLAEYRQIRHQKGITG